MVEVLKLDNPEIVYNFEVGELHTYYVGGRESQSNSFLLVHNPVWRNFTRRAVLGLGRAVKGRAAETAARMARARQGINYIRARLPRNNGFDGVFKRKGKFGIDEIKFSADGKIHLSYTKTMGRQMDETWIRTNIKKNDPL